MKSPCSNCPFRRENGITLNRSRKAEITSGLLHDGDFPCHKTVDYSGESPRVTQHSKRCMGAAAYLEQVALGGIRANVMFRLGLMSKEFTIADVQAIVASGEIFESLTEFQGAMK